MKRTLQDDLDDLHAAVLELRVALANEVRLLAGKARRVWEFIIAILCGFA